MSEAPIHPEDERLKILRMVEDGKITAEQAITLLGSLSQDNASRIALEPEPPASVVPEAPIAPIEPVAPVAPAAPVAPKSNGGLRFFKVRVTDTNTGKSKVSVTLPLKLVDWGLKISPKFAPEMANIDIDQLSEALHSGLEGKLVDVVDDEDGEHVEIFIE